MDKDEELLKILGKLRGGSLEDVADKLMALFREPEWWEAEFDAQFGVPGATVGNFTVSHKSFADKELASASEST